MVTKPIGLALLHIRTGVLSGEGLTVLELRQSPIDLRFDLFSLLVKQSVLGSQNLQGACNHIVGAFVTASLKSLQAFLFGA